MRTSATSVGRIGLAKLETTLKHLFPIYLTAETKPQSNDLFFRILDKRGKEREKTYWFVSKND
jgi:hypothetical protein